MVCLIINERKERIMNGLWWINGWILLVFIVVLQLNLTLCLSLNDEGIALLNFKGDVVNDPFGALSSWVEKVGENDHCLWFGIQCVDGHVVSLNLENLCLEGTLAPELQQLLHIKSILLRNNSFSGDIPIDIENLKKLELLDLSYNNFITPLPNEFVFDLPILLFEKNGLSCHLSSEPQKNVMQSETVVDDISLTDIRDSGSPEDANHARMLETLGDSRASKKIVGFIAGKNPIGNQTQLPPAPAPAPVRDAATKLSPLPPKVVKPIFDLPPPTTESPPKPDSSADNIPSPVQTSPPPPPEDSKKIIGAVVGAVGGFIFLVLAIGLCLWFGIIRKTGSWPKGLSGQLQKAFVSGIQNLKRAELEAACEDFSNVIGTCSIGTIYKGTLSNGLEIAVIALAATSAKDWPKSLESQFRKKLETLSKVNHKNFVSLIGYCEEVEPFTRMMVFEYAPNGSLFEHLHVREAEHLDWGMRLRAAMGMAYCLEHMHQLTPQVTHPDLNSSAVFLSEDYAAKISDFSFWNEVAAAQVQPVSVTNLCASSSSPENNVYSFGLVLLEMVTGRIPQTMENNNSVEDWVLEFMDGDKSLQELVDPMLRRYSHEQLEKISELIRKCLNSDPQLRPTMKDIAVRLKEITTIDQNKAGPRLSPLWWAELEGRSMNGSEGSHS